MRQYRLAAPILAFACSDYTVGLSEPVRVAGAEFHEGALPVDDDATTPLVTNAGGVGSTVTEGQSGMTFAGLTTTDAWAVAIALDGAGTGYWVLPVGAPDPTAEGQLSFEATASFGREIPIGMQRLVFSAIDVDEQPGPSYGVDVCVLPEYADGNLASCVPEVPPQDTVLSLSFSTDVDLDLVVVTPDGKIVRAKTPTTAPDTGAAIPGTIVNDPTTGRLTRDSNGDCVIDSVRRESLVFVGEPPPGPYDVYASLNAACGQPSVTFDLTLYQRVDHDDGTFTMDRFDLASGQFLAVQADGGESLGTFLGAFELPYVAP